MAEITSEMITLANELADVIWGGKFDHRLTDEQRRLRAERIADRHGSAAALRAEIMHQREEKSKEALQLAEWMPRIDALDATARSCLGDACVDALRAYLDECKDGPYGGLDPRKSAYATFLLNMPTAQKPALIVYLYNRLTFFKPYIFPGDMRGGLIALVVALAKSAPPVTQNDIVALMGLMAQPDRGEMTLGFTPDPEILRLCERRAKAETFREQTRDAIRTCLARFDELKAAQEFGAANSHDRKFLARLWGLLQGETMTFRMPDTLWGNLVERELDQLPNDASVALRNLLEFAAKGSGASATDKWVKDAKALLAQSDRSLAAQALLHWVEALHPEALSTLRAALNGPRDARALERLAWRLPSHHQEQARRMLWLAAMADARYAAPILENLARRTNATRHPQYGMPMSVVFSGAVSALAMIERNLAAPALLRLRRKMKGVGDQKTIDKALASLAVASGVSVTTLEEACVPDFRFGIDGEIEMAAGAGRARIALDAGTSVSLRWIDAAGKSRRVTPRAKNDSAKEEIAAARALAKEIAETLKSHAARLERLYLADHSWTYDEWRRAFRDQPLLRHLADGLIWSFEQSGARRLALPINDTMTDEAGRTLTVADDAIVRLWHPIATPVDIIQAWRRRILSLQITQPVKQAYREVYLLTDAERATGDYSNRFAAHIISQPQFRALAKAREWRAPLSGFWDGPEHPRRILPAHGLVAEFVTTGVDAPTGDRPDGAYGAYGLLSTDRVRFTSAQGDYVAFDRIPPVVFSEIMRDVDLFVGVASIGANAQWSDQGANRRFTDYWKAQAFGELSGSASTRRELIADLLPALSIADRCELTDRALVVTGKFNRYRIHLGSGNILMEPGSRYLCIVPSGAGARAANLRLPFEGDAVLSIILSKAFLLVEDDKIKDRSIVSQIRPLV